MPPRLRPADPAALAAALAADPRTRDDVRLLVKHFLAVLSERAPGRSVEVRVPPFVAVQCVDGPRHTRGTPPNVVECAPRVWLRLATGLVTVDEAMEAADLTASGSRAGEIARYLPVLRL